MSSILSWASASFLVLKIMSSFPSDTTKYFTIKAMPCSLRSAQYALYSWGGARVVPDADATALALLLPWQFQCGCQEVRQRCKGPTGLDKDVQKIGRTGLFLREGGELNIILALQVCQQWVLWVVPTRVALERVTAKGASGVEGLGRNDALPALRVRHDGVANPGECVSVRMRHTAGDKHSPRLEVQVKARSMSIATSFVTKMCPSVRLIGALVLCEAHIAMDAKQRAPIGASVSD